MKKVKLMTEKHLGKEKRKERIVLNKRSKQISEN